MNSDFTDFESTKPNGIWSVVFGRGRIILFSSPKFLDMLFRSTTIGVDGTIKCLPKFFVEVKGQMFGFHAKHHDVLFTLL